MTSNPGGLSTSSAHKRTNNRLPLEDSAEIVIVGAGLAGLAAAWFLAPNHDVLILEQGPSRAAEASAQNAGMLRRLVADPVERALACRSFRYLETPVTDHWSVPPWRKTGAVIASVGKAPALQAAANDLDARGVTTHSLTTAELGQLLPMAASLKADSIWYLPDAGTTDAWTLCSGLLRGARSEAARLRLNTKVTGLSTDGSRVNGVTTPTGRIGADKVVVAAGAWSGSLAGPGAFPPVLTPLHRHLIHSAPHAASNPDQPWLWIDDAGLYLRPEGEGWLCSPCDESPGMPSPEPGSIESALPGGLELLHEKLTKLLPRLGPLRIRGGWRGLRTFAPDRRPVVGPDPEREGLWWAAGLGGHGVTTCFAIGELLMARMDDSPIDWVDWRALDPGRTALEPHI